MMPNDFVKLKVDGSILPNDLSTCGGMSRDGNGSWIFGFYSKLPQYPPAMFEILGTGRGLSFL